MGRVGAVIEPVRERHEALEGRLPEQHRQGQPEAPRIGDQVPVARKAGQPLQLRKRQVAGAQHVVGRRRVEAQVERLGVAGDRCPAQPLQDTQLDLVGTDRRQAVEAGGEALDGFARQPGDQVDMEVRARLGQQPGQVLLGAPIVLSAADQCLDLRVPGLDADLELQAAGRKARDQLAQRRRQMVGHQLEVREHRVVGRRLDPFQEKAQDRRAGVRLQVEGAVDESEVPGAPRVQGVERLQHPGQRERPGGLVERRQAELAFERTAARGFQVEMAFAQVAIAVLVIGQGDCVEVRAVAGDHLHQRSRSVEQLAGQSGESLLGCAGDDVIGQRADRLRPGLVAHLGPAQHDRHLGRDPAQHLDQPGGLLDVPDVDPEADHPRRLREQFLDHVLGPRADHEFHDRRAFAQPAQVRAQAAQPQRGMGMTGVEAAEDQFRHRWGM